MKRANVNVYCQSQDLAMQFYKGARNGIFFNAFELWATKQWDNMASPPNISRCVKCSSYETSSIINNNLSLLYSLSPNPFPLHRWPLANTVTTTGGGGRSLCSVCTLPHPPPAAAPRSVFKMDFSGFSSNRSIEICIAVKCWDVCVGCSRYPLCLFRN